jgi:hypothetical protein
MRSTLARDAIPLSIALAVLLLAGILLVLVRRSRRTSSPPAENTQDHDGQREPEHPRPVHPLPQHGPAPVPPAIPAASPLPLRAPGQSGWTAPVTSWPVQRPEVSGGPPWGPVWLPGEPGAPPWGPAPKPPGLGP